MQGMNFLSAKYNLQDKQNIIDIIEYYADQGRFFEAYNYLNHAMYYHDMSNVYYSMLTKYLSEKRESRNISDPLLITWTITPKNVPFLFMSDPEQRLKESMLGLAAWIMDKSFTNIHVVENSAFNLDKEKLRDIGLDHNKVVKYYNAESCEEASKFGKGYGEGDITKFAVLNTAVGRSKRFTKVTGKQYVPFYEYSFMNNGETYEFFNLQHVANRVAVDTRFYCIDTKFYTENMIDAYKQVNDHRDNYLEHVFYENTKNRINYFPPKEPIVFGKQGSIDKTYGEYPKLVYDFSEDLIRSLL